MCKSNPQASSVFSKAPTYLYISKTINVTAIEKAVP